MIVATRGLHDSAYRHRSAQDEPHRCGGRHRRDSSRRVDGEGGPSSGRAPPQVGDRLSSETVGRSSRPTGSGSCWPSSSSLLAKTSLTSRPPWQPGSGWWARASPRRNEPNDALSTAIAALRAKRLRTAVAENHGAVLAPAGRSPSRLGLSTQPGHLSAPCRGAVPNPRWDGTSAVRRTRAAAVLRSVRPGNEVDVERKRMALGFVADIRRLDAEIAAVQSANRQGRGGGLGHESDRALMGWAPWWPPF